MNTPDDDGAHLSSLSALFGLAALAINILLQPHGGKICSFSTPTRRYLRISPFVCVADAVGVVIRVFTYFFYYKISVGAACRLAVVRRRVVEGEEYVRKMGEGEYLRFMEGSLNSGVVGLGEWKGRVVGFVLLGLGQWVKIVACSGTTWTSTWASFYFWSFVVIEGVNALSRRVREEERDHRVFSRFGIDELDLEHILDSWDWGLGGFAVSQQIVMIVVLERWISEDGRVLPFLVWVLMRVLAWVTMHFVFMFMVIPFNVFNDATRATHREDGGLLVWKRVVAGVLLSSVFVSAVGVWGRGMLAFSHFMGSLCVICFVYSLRLFRRAREGVLLFRETRGGGEGAGDDGDGYDREAVAKRAAGASTERMWSGMVVEFVGCVGLFGVFEYLYVYDAGSTGRPRWTGFLG
ncbi:hypothetical protein TWF481_010013 [Arthrobotrys musiformis]|uniref:Uncharacterized protein n=1 Tax=Arthrobotrys musiformis TaxID=47236 RepID=A0AAV9W0L9_9PEZI